MKYFLVFLLLTAGCTQAPFVDSRREAGSPEMVGESTKDRVAVCYNVFSTNQTEIIHLAQAECQKTGREAKYSGHKYWSCRVLLPHRVYYTCENAPQE